MPWTYKVSDRPNYAGEYVVSFFDPAGEKDHAANYFTPCKVDAEATGILACKRMNELVAQGKALVQDAGILTDCYRAVHNDPPEMFTPFADECYSADGVALPFGRDDDTGEPTLF